MAKTSEKRKAKSVKLVKSEDTSTPLTSPITQAVSRLKTYRPERSVYIALVIVGLALLAYFNKGWFVAASVNGQPITTLELQRRLNASYKEPVLNQMIGERILEQEGAKKGVVISQQDINGRVEQDEQSYGGKEVFEMLLSQQGLSRDDYQTRVKALLLIERMYQDEIKPNDEEIKAFMAENSTLPEATDEAKFRQFATDQLSQQKLSQVFSQKFSELRAAANVKFF
jgi:hypothetical protein